MPDLLLSGEGAAEICAGLQLPALEKILSRGKDEKLPVGALATWLCNAFGVSACAVAPVTLRADGMDPGAAYWLRADPVHARVEHDRLITQPAELSMDDAARLCESMNAHFAATGLHFSAPHPQRWYLRLEREPQITMPDISASRVRDIRNGLPQGAEALHWHGILNEIQMLLYEHPVNQAREARGECAVNSVFLWGGGRASGTLRQPAARIYTDDSMTAAFAAMAGIKHYALPKDATSCVTGCDGAVLVVWGGLQRAVLAGSPADWRDSLQCFEQSCLRPLLELLRHRQIETITLDAPEDIAPRRFVLSRREARKFWRRRRLAEYIGVK